MKNLEFWNKYSNEDLIKDYNKDMVLSPLLLELFCQSIIKIIKNYPRFDHYPTRKYQCPEEFDYKKGCALVIGIAKENMHRRKYFFHFRF